MKIDLTSLPPPLEVIAAERNRQMQVLASCVRRKRAVSAIAISLCFVLFSLAIFQLVPLHLLVLALAVGTVCALLYTHIGAYADSGPVAAVSAIGGLISGAGLVIYGYSNAFSMASGAVMTLVSIAILGFIWLKDPWLDRPYAVAKAALARTNRITLANCPTVLAWCIKYPELAAYQNKVVELNRALIDAEVEAMKEWIDDRECQSQRASNEKAQHAARSALESPIRLSQVGHSSFA